MTSPVEEDQLQGLTRHWPGLIAMVRDAEARTHAAEAALAALKAEVVEVVGRIADRASDGRRTASLPVIAREARDLLAKLKGGGQ